MNAGDGGPLIRSKERTVQGRPSVTVISAAIPQMSPRVGCCRVPWQRVGNSRIAEAGLDFESQSRAALGRYFTAVIKVSPDQPVVRNGPYHLLRHPSYAGGLLAEVGIAVTAANWVTVAVFVMAWVAIIAWRINIEETALLSALGDKYRSYALHCKSLIPLVW
jgi:hypothetical protein